MSATRLTLFASTVPGLEDVLAAELRELAAAHRESTAAERAGELGLGDLRTTSGGVEFDGDWHFIARVLLGSRVAESVRLRLRRFRATNFDQLIAESRKVQWHAYLPQTAALDVSAVCHKSRLYHSDAVAERVDAVIREARRLGPGEGTPFRVHARLDHDEVTLSLDCSGELQHRRGYRLHTVPAPIRETLAAAVLRLAKLPVDQPLWDPFCGSGTFCFEHALHGALVGARRSFAAERFPTAPRAAFTVLRAAAPSVPAPTATGTDLSEDAVRAALANQATWPDAFGSVRFSVADFEAAAESIAPGTAIVTNPPYGLRLLGEPHANRQLASLFDRFERLLERRPDLGPVVLVCGDQRFLREHRLRWTRLASFPNGGASVTVLMLES